VAGLGSCTISTLIEIQLHVRCTLQIYTDKWQACGLTCRITDQYSQHYAMTSEKRGLCVMINNRHFSPQSGFFDRAAADLDMCMLHVVFTQLGFDIAMHADVTAEKMLTILVEGLRLVQYYTQTIKAVIHIRLCPDSWKT